MSSSEDKKLVLELEVVQNHGGQIDWSQLLGFE